MSNDPVIGIVQESLPSTLFRVKLDSGQEVICYLAGKMRVHNIKVLLGDRVAVILDPYRGKTSNRIVRRL